MGKVNTLFQKTSGSGCAVELLYCSVLRVVILNVKTWAECHPPCIFFFPRALHPTIWKGRHSFYYQFQVMFSQENDLKWVAHVLHTVCQFLQKQTWSGIRWMHTFICSSGLSGAWNLYFNCPHLLQLMPNPTAPHLLPQTFLHTVQLGNQLGLLLSLAAEFSANFWWGATPGPPFIFPFTVALFSS